MESFERLCLKALSCPDSLSPIALSLLQSAQEGHLCLEGSFPPLELPPSLVQQENRLYLQKNWALETLILKHLQRLSSRSPSSHFSLPLFHNYVTSVPSLLPAQKNALFHALSHPFTLLSGGPGTGKTFTAGHFVRALIASLDRAQKPELHIALAAPTGKAALHLKSALLSLGELPSHVHCEAYTLHRLLKLRPGENKLYTPSPIDADLILVDEASMIDATLLAHLLQATRSHTHLILMGDPDQLPPVEAASLFAPLTELFAISLHHSMRTSNPHLQLTAQAIREGNPSFLTQSPPRPIDSSLLPYLYQKIAPLISDIPLDPSVALTHYNRCRILNALRQGPLGSDVLNRHLFHQMEQDTREGQWWALPIMISVNAPQYELYNGTSGVLIGQKKKRLDLFNATAYFPDSEPFSKIPPFEIAFCLSIHKSQGSEFEEVIALFPQGSERFGRESLYTAATRAKKSWEIFGDGAILTQMLAVKTERASGLKARWHSMPDV